MTYTNSNYLGNRFNMCLRVFNLHKEEVFFLTKVLMINYNYYAFPSGTEALSLFPFTLFLCYKKYTDGSFYV